MYKWGFLLAVVKNCTTFIPRTTAATAASSSSHFADNEQTLLRTIKYLRGEI